MIIRASSSDSPAVQVVAEGPKAGSVAVGPEIVVHSTDFQRLFEEHVAFVWRVLQHLGVAQADLEDTSQEVFLVVHRRLAEFEGRSSVRTWLYGIAARIARRHRDRAYHKRESAAASAPEPAELPRQHEDLERGRLRALLLAALDALDDDKRAVFVLYEIEEMTMAEVARAVGCPLQTAYSRLHAARRKVAEEVARRTGEGKAT
jgi:RNA polymerase sigma-70 factor (ECF subfamily)